ncbi:hypothetical protein SAMN06295933_1670 [Desulfovibrio gilichinskyi]|uniref:Polysaccharide deacetylase n=2 Tax=Desulfovibrio gilichinskyi TaxID=1519643 RepID=A0A1X7D5C9_9BACT|nr:hypothetical protein SAMN06295933_1670 [Desulfovibrio gilichinskyi]
MRLLLSFIIFILSFSTAVPMSYGAQLKRKVMVLYNSAEKQNAQGNLFVEGFAMPLNYLGILYEVRDVNKRPLPDAKQMEQCIGIFTTFADEFMEKPEDYLKWLINQQENGRKVIIAGSFGARQNLNNDAVDPALVKRVYSNLGFSWQGNATNNSVRLVYDNIDPKEMNFERNLPLFPPRYAQIIAVDDHVKPWVTVKIKDNPNSSGVAVAAGPKGGIALDGYMRWQDPVTFIEQWYLNPFDFLQQSLNLKGIPALTPTTLNGLRVAFAHIDGDGFAGYTEIDKNKNCAEILMERIFSRYDFPNSASVIAGEIDPDVKGSPANVLLARTLFEMKNIEPASHSYTHPFAWNKKLRESPEYKDEFVVGQYEKAGYKFNATYEIVDSCKYISTDLTPPDHPCKTLFWSGMCDPVGSQAEIVKKAGLLNLNGGDTIFDASHNSYFGVSPLYKPLGEQSQIYTGQANENILTNLWAGPYFGFRNIVETMKRTGTPRRVMPIDIYYHFYSGEKFASLKALEDVYDWVVSQNCAKVYASAYIKMVNGYLSGKIDIIDADHFVISDYDDCLSLRLDGADKVPDLANCKNIIGYDIEPEGIFVHLNPGTGKAELVLSSNIKVNDGVAYIKSGSGWIKDFKRSERGVRFIFECFNKGKIVVAGLKPDHKFKIVGNNFSAMEVTSSNRGEVLLQDVTSGPLEISLI